MIRRLIGTVVIIINMFGVTGCGAFLNAAVGMEPSTGESADSNSAQDIPCEITDMDRNTSPDNTARINLGQIAEESSLPEGCTYSEGTLTISGAGAYALSGRADGCNIVIDTYDDETVHIILDGAELYADNGPAIFAKTAAKVILTAADGTENIISDSAQYSTDREACIFSDCDLALNGTGRLNVYGYYHDAIRSRDRVKLIGANVYVRAKNDGIRGNDGVVIDGSFVAIESEGTGILTDSQGGYVVLRGGVCRVTSGENAIYADHYVSIQDCENTLYSVREAVRCSGIREIEEADEK